MAAKMGAPIKMPATDNIVAKLRRTLGIGQVELAELLGTTHQAVSHWETGRRVVSGPAERLCKVLLKYPDILDGLDDE